MGSFPLSVKLKALNMAEKKHMSVVICGHVDSGKSTTTGRLLFELGGIPEREMVKLKEEAEKIGKGSFAFAFYMDTQKDERERGVTIKCTTKEFFTDNYHYSVIDAPGHRDFIKNMISGAAQADVGVLMVPADGNFTTAIQKGDHKQGIVQGQTRQHARLINLLGVKQLVCGVNKMDADLALYKEECYNEIRDEMKSMLVKVGWPKGFVEKKVPILPISGWNGDNLLTKSDNMAWWKGMKCKISKEKAIQVVTLKDALNDFVQVAKRDPEKPMRLPVSGVYKIKGVGDVLTGRVEQGNVLAGKEVIFLPTHTASTACPGKIFTVEMHHKRLEDGGKSGDNIGMNVKNLNKDNMPRVGDVMIYSDDASLKTSENFSAQVSVLDIPGQLKAGYSPIGHVRCGRAACRLQKICWKIGKETGGDKAECPPHLKTNDQAEAIFEPQQPMVVDKFSNCEGLARIAFLDGNSAVMLGKVQDVNLPKDW